MNAKTLEYLPPDLYLRYYFGFEIIKKIQKNNPCNILDVGGRAGIMGDLIKINKLPYKLTVIDTLPDIESPGTLCSKYLEEDFLKVNFKEKYDYIVTFDVLEHIDNKLEFVEKCLSSCKSLILSAPFKSEIVVSAEKIIDEYFFKYKNVHHPWLKEHFEKGLPEMTWLKRLLVSKSINFEVIETNNIENWVNFTLPNTIPSLFPVDIQKLNEINKYYNQNYQDLGDNIPPTYRNIFVTYPSKNDISNIKLASRNSKINVKKKIFLTNLITDFLTSTIKKGEEYSFIKNNIVEQTNNLSNENIKLKKDIKEINTEIESYTILINQITSSKFYKLWQSYNNYKKIIKL